MSRMKALGALAASTLLLAACEEDFHTDVGPVGRAAFANYVAVGTSISMGVRNGNNALTAETQIQAWPSLLASRAGRPMRLALFQSPGCYVPVVAPIAFGVSQNSLPGNPIQPNTACADLQAGVEIPAQNVAISGHDIYNAVYQTPESASVACPSVGPCVPPSGDAYRRLVVPKLLPPQRSQVGAMAVQNPTFVSIEIGANDVLGATSGIVSIAGPKNPLRVQTADTAFTRLFDVIVDSVQKTGARALIMGLPSDIKTIPSMRQGRELYADSITFSRGFYVTISSNCGTTFADNWVFTTARVLAAIAAGRTAQATGQPRPVLSCQSINTFPGQTFTQDAILTPAEVDAVNALIASYNAKMQAVATENGWAYATIAAPFERPKGTFSVAAMMSSVTPFGPYIGLDGLHPTSEGQKLIANSAIAAINATYDFEIPLIPVAP